MTAGVVTHDQLRFLLSGVECVPAFDMAAEVMHLELMEFLYRVTMEEMEKALRNAVKKVGSMRGIKNKTDFLDVYTRVSSVVETMERQREQGCRQMFIDEIIGLRKDLPDRLKCDFVELRKYYDAGDWFNFDIFLKGLRHG